jgi:hypothetical protein
MKISDFVILILTHGRSNNVITINTLRKCGYTGRIVLVIDDTDKQRDDYIQNFGIENVRIFDKSKYAALTDQFDNFNDWRTITHARNASYDIAKELGYRYFIQMDDDFTGFQIWKIKDDQLKAKEIQDLDLALLDHWNFYINSPFQCIAFAQGGDFIGGSENPMAIEMGLKRKAMNSFFCSVKRRVWFIGRLNEDVNTYTTLGSRGMLFGTCPWIKLVQKQTQSQAGGITEAYKEYGTYVKSMYTVMTMPSSVQVGLMGRTEATQRMHHKIKWQNTVPKILSEAHKKHKND